MSIEDMTPEQREVAAGLVRQYQLKAAEAREAGTEKADNARPYAEAAKAAADKLWDRHGLNVQNAAHRREIRRLLAEHGETVVAIHHDTMSTGESHPYVLTDHLGEADECDTLALAAPAESVERWRKAQQAYAEAQQEMKRFWDKAAKAIQDHQEVQELLEHFRWSDEMDEIKAQMEAQEAEWDKEYGPREWAVTTFHHKLNRSQVEVRGRIHKKGCASLAKVWGNSTYDKVHVITHLNNVSLLRKHDAIKVLREGAQGIRTIVVCQHCAKELEGEQG